MAILTRRHRGKRSTSKVLSYNGLFTIEPGDRSLVLELHAEPSSPTVSYRVTLGAHELRMIRQALYKLNNL